MVTPAVLWHFWVLLVQSVQQTREIIFQQEAKKKKNPKSNKVNSHMLKKYTNQDTRYSISCKSPKEQLTKMILRTYSQTLRTKQLFIMLYLWHSNFTYLIYYMYENQVSGFRGSIPPAPHTGPGETSPLRVSHPEYVRRKESTGWRQQAAHSRGWAALFLKLSFIQHWTELSAECQALC